MEWLVFAYTLPSQARSSPRVTLWRRLRRLGAVTPAGSVYVLPPRTECAEAFQWLAQEVRQAGGEAMVMHVDHFEGLTDQQVIALFQRARDEEYLELDHEAKLLEESTAPGDDREADAHLRESLERLRRRYTEIVRVDYFNNAGGVRLAARLDRIQKRIASATAIPLVQPVPLAAYRDVRWMTRPRPHVDRLACAWLIRRFVNPNAVIRYAREPEPGEVAFDLKEGGQFGHLGNLCTFEVMVRAFALADVALAPLAEIVHAIDLRDERYVRSETAGIEAVLDGWLLAIPDDATLEAHGIALFDGLFATLARSAPSHQQQVRREPAPSNTSIEAPHRNGAGTGADRQIEAS